MAEKISWTELRRLVATRAGISEKNAGLFLASLNAQVIEALKTERQVKINGLGTFKLQAVAPRKSVDVTTGEEITIPGYNKVVFSAESGVKELIEKSGPAAAPVSKAKSKKPKAVPTDVNDPLQKLGVQAAEIVDILGELGQNPQEEPKQPKKAAAKPKRTPKAEKTEPAVVPVPEPEKVEITEPEKQEEPAPVTAPKPTPVIEQEVNVTVTEPAPVPFVIPEEKEPEPEPEQPKKKKKHHFWRDTLICVLILLLLLGAAYFFFRNEISNWIKSFVEGNKTEQVAEGDEQKTEEKSTTAAFAEGQEAIAEGSETQPTENETEDIIVIEELTYDKLLKTESIPEGSRLAWIAKKYYGSKIYWPYLYDANKDHLSDPNIIVVGTPIRVPKLTALQKDTTNAQTMAIIEHLRTVAEAAME